MIVAPVRVERLSLEIEALGTAHANESIDVTAKVSNLVTAVRFTEGQHVARGDLLVELDGSQARAELAIAEAAVTESRSQYKRSRELYTTKALSEAQLDQIEAALKANEARVLVAQAKLRDTVIRAPFAGRVGLRRVSVGSLVNPGAVITTLDDTDTIKLDFTVPETYLSTLEPGLAITARSVAYPGRSFRWPGIECRFAGRSEHALGDGSRPGAEPGRPAEARHVPERAAHARRSGRAARARAGAGARAGRRVRVRGQGRHACEKRLIRTGQRRVGTCRSCRGSRPASRS